MITACTRCHLSLRRQPCGCWTDTDWGTRWCHDSQHLHQPDGGLQPKTCQGAL